LSLTIVAGDAAGLPVVALALVVGHWRAAPATGPGVVASPATTVSAPGGGGRPGLLRQLGGDVRRLPGRGRLATLAAGGAASLAVRAWDRPVADSFLTAPGRGGFLVLGDTLGGSTVQCGIALATYSTGRLFRSRGATDLGRDLIRAQALNGLLTHALKRTVRRERPNGGTRLSFPSGHASATFATATVLGRRYGWRVGAPAFAAAAYVAASRVRDRKHFLSDVTFGSALGIAAAGSITVTGRDRRLAIAPVVFRHGPGLALRLRLGGS
jgi:membrane-associated phospholipid phosphatase